MGIARLLVNVFGMFLRGDGAHAALSTFSADSIIVALDEAALLRDSDLATVCQCASLPSARITAFCFSSSSMFALPFTNNTFSMLTAHLTLIVFVNIVNLM